MKILHFTDPHLNPLNAIPQGRTGSFHEDVLAELTALREVVVREDIALVCLSGDVFNLKRPERYRPQDVIHYRDIFESFNVPIFCIPGNHDMPLASVDEMHRAPYTLLVEATPNMRDVSHKVVKFGSVTVSGVPYYPSDGIESRLEHHNSKLDPGVRNVVLLHLDVYPDVARRPPWIEGLDYDDLTRLMPNATIFLMGHIHVSFDVEARKESRQLWSKPYSFGRVVKDYFATMEDIAVRHVPAYCILEMGEGYVEARYDHVPHRPPDACFRLDTLQRRLERNEKLRDYLESLEDSVHPSEFRLESPADWLRARRAEIPEPVQAIIDEYVPEVEA